MTSAASGLRMLLVEDNEDDIEAVSRVIERSGVGADLAVARDGEQALDMLSAPPWPGLVLLDLRLPKADGFQVLRRIRKDPRLTGLPVVVLSGSADNRPVRRCMDMGTNMYITKPLDIADVINIVTSVHRYWRRAADASSAAGRSAEEPA